ncbi:hypothetical protein F4009_18285 [Candidatus Poribacteria bacterium]|nr:hypothetical protein [Candidatus Poribacteria bacterium]
MSLRFERVGGGSQGKFTWHLIWNDGEKETVIAHAPDNYGRQWSYDESIDRFKKAVQVDFSEG